MKITKRRDGDVWRVQADGRDTALTIEKSEFKPKWGERQEWLVIDGGGDTVVLRLYSVGDCLTAIERIAAALAPTAISEAA